MNKTKIITLAACVAFGFSGHAQNLLLNGSFESPSVQMNTFSSTPPDSWLATGALNYTGIINGDYSPGYPLPENGQQYAHVGNSSSLSQAFTIDSPGTYVLRWFDSSEYNGPGAFSPYSVRVTDSANNSLAGADFDANASGLRVWAFRSMEFTLVPGAYTLRFDGRAGIFAEQSLIDNVSLERSGIGNQPPVANAQTVTTSEESPVSISLVATDPENDLLTYAVVTSPAHGTLSGTPPSLLYTPAAGFSGLDSFTFQASDDSLVSAPAQVSITVTPTSAALAQTVFVANTGANNVSVIDAASNTVIDTIPVGVQPRHVEVSPDGKRVYVSNQGSDSVSVIDVASHAVVATIAVGTAPVGVAASPDNLKVYVTHDSGASVDFVWVIDVATLTASVAFSLPNQANAEPTATFDPNGSEIWIKNGCGDFCTRRVAYPSHIVLGDLPAETAGGNASENHISFVPGTQLLYAAHSCGCCGHFDRSQYSPSFVYTGRRYEDGQGSAQWTVAAPAGGIAYLARVTHCTSGSSVIRKESAAGDTTVASLTIPGVFTRVGAITPDGSRLYLTTAKPDGTSPTVTVVDTASMSVVTTIPVGDQPFGIAIVTTGTPPENNPPVAKCKNVTVSADSNCSANASVDDGSFDPDGDSIMITQSPAVPYPLGQTTVTLTVTDINGASNSCTALVTVRDITPPSITCPANLSVPCSTEPLVAVSFPPPTVSDNCDSAPTVAYSIPSGSGFPSGTTTVTATATDASGNHNSCSFTVTREPLSFIGFLSPIGGADATGGSFADPLRTFKLNSTIPVKFTSSCGGSPVVDNVHTLQAVKWSSQTDSDPAIDATPTDAATTGNQFRSVGGEWHFNLDTKATGMSTGKWQLTATLSDGSQHSVWIQLK